MELYPSIPTRVTSDSIYAFDKLDGSNIRVEWSVKTGFSKFGTRTRLLDVNEKPFGEAVDLFNEKYADDLERIFRKNRFQKTTAFMEFYGANSFAGFHAEEKHDVMLFDLHVYKQGMLPPKEFLKLFEGKIETAELLYEGKATASFIEKVKTSSLEGMSFEGVVCKGALDNRRRPVTFKIKSEAWLTRLKNKYGHDERLYNKLV